MRVLNHTYGRPDPGRGSPGAGCAAETDREVDIGKQPLYVTMGRITSNVDEEVITRIDALASAEGLSRSEWVARAVIDRLAVEERGVGVPQEETVPRTVHEYEVRIRDERITDLKETLNWTRGELAERGRQHELLITSIPQMLPAPKGDRFWDRLFGWTKKE